MLVLSRKVDQRLVVDIPVEVLAEYAMRKEPITFEIVNTGFKSGGFCKIGVDADRRVQVHRKEIDRENT